MEIDQVPGWDAIEGALRQLYPGQQPLHCGTVVKYLEGGPDPLDGISIYDHGDHWQTNEIQRDNIAGGGQ